MPALTRLLRRLALVLFLSIGLSGCRQNVDLSALDALAKSTAASSAAFAALSGDFSASCVRTVQWQRASQPSAPDVFSSCAEAGKAARQWQSANDVVTAYIASLGTLAGGGSDPGDYGLKNFAAALGATSGVRGFSSAQQTASSAAAASLVNDYFNIRRRDALAQTIPAADADLATLITTLEDVAKTNYVTSLTSERIALRLFFEPNIASAKPGVERLIAFNYRLTEKAQLDTIDERQSAVDHYVSALELIKKTHHQIAAAITSDRQSDVTAIVQTYFTQATPELAALSKAFR